jgi:hypothetical protein
MRTKKTKTLYKDSYPLMGSNTMHEAVFCTHNILLNIEGNIRTKLGF